MKKMTIPEYADFKNISVQSVYYQIKKNKLEVLEENNTKYIIVDDGSKDIKNNFQDCKGVLKEYKQLLKMYKKEIKELKKSKDENYIRLENLFRMQLEHKEPNDIIDVKVKKKKKNKRKK